MEPAPGGADLQRRGGSGPPGGRGRPRLRVRLSESSSAPSGRPGDLGRRAASAGHGGLEPGRGGAYAPRDARGESGQGRALSRGGGCGGPAG